MWWTYTLIQDQKADLRQTEFPSGYEVVQSAGRSHHNVNLMNHEAKTTHRRVDKINGEQQSKNDVLVKTVWLYM